MKNFKSLLTLTVFLILGRVLYGQIDCSQAIKIDCEYVVKTTDQLTSKISYFNNEAYHTNELLEIEGKGQILELYAQNIYPSSLDILIFEETCTESNLIRALRYSNNIDNSYLFKFANGKKYFLSVGKSVFAPYEYTNSVTIRCRELNELTNHPCYPSISELSCDKTNNIEFSNARFIDLSNENETPYGYKSVFTKIKGNGNVHSIVSNITGRYSVYKGTCDGLIALSQTNVPKLNFLSEDSVDYYIKFDIIQPVYGNNIDFTVTCQEQSVNDLCEGAIELNCDTNFIFSTSGITLDSSEVSKGFITKPTQWFNFKGNDKTIELQFFASETYYYLFDKDCSINEPILVVGDRPHNGLKFYAEPNKEYRVAVSTDEVSGNASTKCYNKSENDQCKDAIEFPCDTSFIINFSSATYDATEEEKNIISRPTVWYKFTGKDKFIEVKLESEEAFYYLFEGDECGNLKLVRSIQEYYSNGLKFLAEKEITYFVAVSSERAEAQATLNCFEKNLNATCAASSEIKCDTSFNVNTKGSELGEDGKYHLWYKIIGFDGKLNLLNTNGNIKLEVFKINCEITENRILSVPNLNDGEISFEVNSGQTYYIHLSNSDFTGPSEFSSNIDIACSDLQAGDLCTNALAINCPTIVELEGDHLIETNIGDQLFRNTKWYKVTGKGAKAIEPLEINYYIKFFKTANGCENLVPFDEGTEDQPHVKRFIPIEENESLYIMTFSDNDLSLPSGSFKVSCNENDDNFDCITAVNLKNGSEYNVGGKSYKTITSENCLTSESGNYFTIVGNGKNHLLKFSFTENFSELVEIHLSEGEACDPQLTCLSTTIAHNNSPYFSFNSDSGKIYTIKVVVKDLRHTTFKYEELEKIKNISCEEAIQIKSNQSYISLVQNTSETSFACENESFNELVYKISGDGKIYALQFKSIFNYLLASIYEGTCSQNSCILSKQLSHYNSTDKLAILTEIGKEYIIVLEGNDMEVISFDVTTNELPNNNSCETADDIKCDSTYSVELLTPDNYNSDGQNTLHSWFKIQDNQQIYKLTFDNSQEQSFELLGYYGTCENRNIFTEYNSNGTEPFRFFPTGLQDNFFRFGRRRIQDIGSLKFTVTCFQVPENDKCNQASSIACGDVFEAKNEEAIMDIDACVANQNPDVWYKFTGDGNFFKLKLQDSLAEYSGEFLIYENDPCQSACIFSKGFNSSSGSDILFSFKTELGKTYFLKVQSNKNQIFKAVCEPAQANDICSGAIPLVGGITISDFENLSQDKADGCRFLDFPKGQWFEISGKSVLYEIKSNNGFVYTIYEGTDCQNLKCLQVRQLFSGFKLVLNVESNKNYYLILSPIEDNTQFEITEREKETNSICENSKAITCGDTASVNLLRHGPPLNDLFCTSNFPEAWYKIEGKNNAVKLRGFNAEAGNLQYLVRKDCNETCPLNWLPIFSPSDDGNNYFLKEGFEYYLKVAYPENAANTKDPFISVECIDDAYSNVEKQFAIPLTCGSHILDKSRISTSIYNTCFRNNNGTLFYEIPNSGFISIKIDSRIDDASFFIADENCNFVHSLNQNPGFFIPSTGKYYLVIVANSLRNNIEFSVFLNCITSSKEIGNDDLITVTPNPFTNQLIVKSDALSIGKNVGIRLFDLDGRSIFQNSMSVQSEAELNIPVSQHFKNGMYLLELIIDQKRYYKKVIKVQ